MNYEKEAEKKVSEAKKTANADGSIDKAKGHTNETIGKVKQKVGSFIGDEELEAKGAVQNAEGKSQRVKGEVKEAIHDAVEKVKAGAEVLTDKVKSVIKK
ncbi:MAG: CsbD family protein [Pseudomonadota bacterium]